MRNRTERALAGSATVALLGTALLVGTATSSSAAPQTSTATLGPVSVEVTYSETEVMPGDEVTMTAEFTNSSESSQSYYRVNLGNSATPFADVFDLISCTPTPAGADPCSVRGEGSTLRIFAHPLPPEGMTLTATLQVKADATPGEYPLAHELSPLGSGVALDPPLTITVGGEDADVAVGLDAAPGPLLGSQINYDLTATNQGPGDVTEGRVETQLPTQTYSVTNLPDGCSYDSGNDTVSCATGAIVNGDHSVKSFRAHLGLLSIGPLPATATLVSSDPTDPNDANDTASADCTVLTSLIIACN